MKIVVLDGYAMNPGDLSWEPLRSLGDCEIHDRTPAEQTIARLAGAEIAVTNKTVIDADVMAARPELKYVGVLATGYNVVDIPAAAERGIVVTNAPGYSTEAVAQMVFAHLLALTHHVSEHSAGARGGKWAANADFCYWDYPLTELDGRTMGIVGYGQTGRAVAGIARAFGMAVLACGRNGAVDAPGVRGAELAELLRQSDVVSLHCPLTAETRGLMDAARLAKMKPSAFLINTSRGPVVDERALADALNEGRLAGAGVDVLSTEPPAPDNPLLTARNCYVTPHIAWATRAARQRLMDIAVENVRAFLDGRAQNVVS